MDDKGLVTVFGFKMWSQSEGRYRVSRFKAPRDVLAKYQVVVLETTAESVARADLDARGRYLPVGGGSRADSGWRASSFDLASGLDVIEDPPEDLASGARARGQP
jgi:hypothetical protein